MGQTGWLLVDCNLRMYVTGMRAFDEKLWSLGEENVESKYCAASVACVFVVALQSGIDPQAEFFTFIAGLTKFMAAFRLSRKTAVKVLFG